MADDDKGELDLTGPGGIGIRTKGYRVMDLICLGSFILLMATSYLVWQQKAEAGEQSKAVAQALKESNREVAEAVKQTSRDNAEVMKQLTAEQRKTTEAQRETNCLLSLPQDARSNRAEVCKRISRDR